MPLFFATAGEGRLAKMGRPPGREEEVKNTNFLEVRRSGRSAGRRGVVRWIGRGGRSLRGREYDWCVIYHTLLETHYRIQNIVHFVRTLNFGSRKSRIAPAGRAGEIKKKSNGKAKPLLSNDRCTLITPSAK